MMAMRVLSALPRASLRLPSLRTALPTTSSPFASFLCTKPEDPTEKVVFDASAAPLDPAEAAHDAEEAPMATEGAGDTPLSELDEHKALVETLTQEVKELTEQRFRLLADQENTRSIAKRDVAAAREYGVQGFAKKMLEVADNLHLAVSSVDEASIGDDNPQLKTLYEGVCMTNDGLLKAFAANGIQRFGEPGDKFDPNLHDAMFEMASPDLEPGSVAQVVKFGFTLKDRVIRPAQVGTVKSA